MTVTVTITIPKILIVTKEFNPAPLMTRTLRSWCMSLFFVVEMLLKIALEHAILAKIRATARKLRLPLPLLLLTRKSIPHRVRL